METKKILVSTIIAVFSLVVIVVGATYAYFKVDTTNNFGTRTISASAASVGSVALKSSGSNLTMNLTAADMAGKGSNVTYYASSSGKTTELSTATIGTASVTGAGTFTCSYSLKIDDNSTSMYDAFQSMSTKSTGQIVLTVNGTGYDFTTTNLFPKTISGTMTGLVSGTNQNITAQLKVVNLNSVDQSALAGTSITLTFTVTSFTCSLTA